MYQYPTAPRSVWSVIGDSIRLYKKVYKRVFLVTFLITLVFVLVGIPAIILQVDPSSAASIKPKLGLWSAIGLIFVPFVLLFVVSYLKAVLLRFEGEISQNIPTKLKSVFWFALRKYLIVLVASLLILIFVVVGLVLVIPGIFLVFLLMFAPAGILLDNDDVFSSIKHSAKLVWGNWWRTFAVMLIPGIFNLVIFVLFRLFTRYVLFIAPHNMWFYVINAIPILILEPWVIAVVIEQYYDLKLRYQRKPAKETE